MENDMEDTKSAHTSTKTFSASKTAIAIVSKDFLLILIKVCACVRFMKCHCCVMKLRSDLNVVNFRFFLKNNFNLKNKIANKKVLKNDPITNVF